MYYLKDPASIVSAHVEQILKVNLIYVEEFKVEGKTCKTYEDNSPWGWVWIFVLGLSNKLQKGISLCSTQSFQPRVVSKLRTGFYLELFFKISKLIFGWFGYFTVKQPYSCILCIVSMEHYVINFGKYRFLINAASSESKTLHERLYCAWMYLTLFFAGTRASQIPRAV